MTKSQMNKRIKELKLQAQEKLANAKAERTLKYMSTDSYVNSLAKEQTVSKLDDVLRLIEAAYESLEDRKVVNTYGYSLLLDKVITICSNTKYLSREDKESIFLATGLNDILIEDLLDAVGRPAYYSKLNHEIVPEIEFNAKDTKHMLETIEIALDLDTSLDFDEKRIKTTFKRAKERAESMYYSTEEMLDLMKINTEIAKYDE
jgi:hypothetical protein